MLHARVDHPLASLRARLSSVEDGVSDVHKSRVVEFPSFCGILTYMKLNPS